MRIMFCIEFSNVYILYIYIFFPPLVEGKKRVIGLRLNNRTELNGTENQSQNGVSLLQLEFVGFAYEMNNCFVVIIMIR